MLDQQHAAQAEANYSDDVAWRIVGSKVVAFGGNEVGEVFLSVQKNGVTTEFVIGKDEAGEITLYEVEHGTQPASAA